MNNPKLLLCPNLGGAADGSGRSRQSGASRKRIARIEAIATPNDPA